MKQIEFPCPCGGKLKWKKEPIVRDGIDCGILDIEWCQKCGEEYLPEPSMEIVEQRLREQGLWGVKRKEVNLWKSGNSVIIRIPKEIAKKVHFKPDERVFVYAEGERKVVVEG